LQDEVTESITSAIAPEFLSAERKRAERKAPENLDAWDYALRGNWNLWTSDKDRLGEAKRLYLKAIELDEKCMPALCGLALVYNLEILNGWTEDNERTRSLAFEAAHRATMIDARDAMAHAAMGWVFHVMRRPADAVRSLRRALELNPNLAFAEGTLGLALAHQGKYEEAIHHADRAERLNPRDPDSGTWMMARVIAPLVAEKYDEYLQWVEKYVEAYPDHPPGWRHLTSAYAHLGRMEEAREALRRLLELIPDNTIRREQERLPGSYGRLIEGLRKAGMPE
jgi:tetratricopeptide (TPR) repeat protein